MNWVLSPRWKISNGSKPVLAGPGELHIPLDAQKFEAIRDGRLRLTPLAAADGFPEIFNWARKLVSMRVLVPEYLASKPPERSEAEDFYLEIFQAVCGQLSCTDIWPNLRAGLLYWSGAVLKQPLDAPEDYFPSKPSLCIDLLGGSRRSVRIALDCRDPLCTPWENIGLARMKFERRLKDRTDLFRRVCGLVFRDPADFTNPRVKYLHPAVEYLAEGEEISSYWNLGRAANRGELWERSLEIIEAAGGAPGRQIRFRESFGEISQPELIGHTFDPGKPPHLKTYVMFDGLNRETLREIMRQENVLPEGALVSEALGRLEGSGLQPGRNLGIASLYHPLDSSGKPGIKIHLNLRDGFERKFTLEETVKMVSEIGGPSRRVFNPLPESIGIREGRRAQILPYTVSFMLVPGSRLTKITLYVNF